METEHGRDRLQKDAKSRNTAYVARGLCLITGEILPEVAQSRLARCLFLSMNKNSINSKKKAFIENNLEKLAFTMKTYIENILYNYKTNNLMEKIRAYYNSLKSLKDDTQLKTMHGRTYEIGLALKLGFWLYTEFLNTYKIESPELIKKLLNDANETIDHLLELQMEEINEKEPTEMYFNALKQLIATKSIILKDLSYGNLSNPVSEFDIDKFVGFVDAKEDIYYLLPEVVYGKVVDFYAKINIKFPIPERTLRKYLADKKYLISYTTKNRNSSYITPKTIGGNSYRFIKLFLPDFTQNNDIQDENNNYYKVDTYRSKINPIRRQSSAFGSRVNTEQNDAKNRDVIF